MSNLLLERSAQMAKHPLLPREYQQVEYIESTGTQWIDTGICGTEKTTVCATVLTYGSESNGGIIGAFDSSGHSLTIYITPGVTRIRRGNNSIQYAAGVFRANRIYTVENSPTGFYNGSSKILSWSGEAQFTTTYNMFLFAPRNSNNSVVQPLKGRIYNASILDDTTLVRNFIPCLRKADSKAGMYDSVNCMFYVNIGTGNFIAGPYV